MDPRAIIAATLAEASGIEKWRAFVKSVQGSFETQAELIPLVAMILGVLVLLAIDAWVFRRVLGGRPRAHHKLRR